MWRFTASFIPEAKDYIRVVNSDLLLHRSQIPSLKPSFLGAEVLDY